jgi:hypothetical protein
VLGSQGDAGQFRTPRHIIDFIVEVIDPKKNETVLDPACGTAGFLISSYKHILRANTDAKGHSTLTPDEKGRLAQNFKGYDISPDMVRLSLVNMYLHGLNDPHIFEYDTLTSQDRWNEYADVILTNPPFMSPKGGIRPHNRFSVQSKRSEVLFLDYFLEHLTPHGKAGVIVPEGIHFVAQSGHVELRRMLLEGGFLLADITLPHGVFKPYASVKTHVLIIDRALARKSESVLFVEVENDGYSQTDTREPIPGSQLQAAAECVIGFKQSVAANRVWSHKVRGMRAYTVNKAVLLVGRASHLLGRWHDLPNRVIHRQDTPLMRIGDICDIRDGPSPNMATAPGEFVFVVPAEDRKSADHWDFEGKAVCVALVSSSGHGKADIKRLHYQDGKFALATTMCAIFVKDEELIRPRFLHLFLSAMCDDLLVPLMCGATNVTMDSSQLNDVLVPIPAPSIQDEVIESHLIRTTAIEMATAATSLRQSSADANVIHITERVIRDVKDLLNATKNRATIAGFLPQ